PVLQSLAEVFCSRSTRKPGSRIRFEGKTVAADLPALHSILMGESTSVLLKIAPQFSTSCPESMDRVLMILELVHAKTGALDVRKLKQCDPRARPASSAGISEQGFLRP